MKTVAFHSALKSGFHCPSSRAVNSARELGPWTRVVETGLYSTHNVGLTVIHSAEPGLAGSTLTLPLHTWSLTPSHHVFLSQQKGWQWRKMNGGKVHSMTGNWCNFYGRMSVLSPTSAKDIHWNLSFLRPPTDSRVKGGRRRFPCRQKGPLRGSSSTLWRFEMAKVKPNKAIAYDSSRPDNRPIIGQRL